MKMSFLFQRRMQMKEEKETFFKTKQKKNNKHLEESRSHGKKMKKWIERMERLWLITLPWKGNKSLKEEGLWFGTDWGGLCMLKGCCWFMLLSSSSFSPHFKLNLNPNPSSFSPIVVSKWRTFVWFWTMKKRLANGVGFDDSEGSFLENSKSTEHRSVCKYIYIYI